MSNYHLAVIFQLNSFSVCINEGHILEKSHIPAAYPYKITEYRINNRVSAENSYFLCSKFRSVLHRLFKHTACTAVLICKLFLDIADTYNSFILFILGRNWFQQFIALYAFNRCLSFLIDNKSQLYFADFIEFSKITDRVEKSCFHSQSKTHCVVIACIQCKILHCSLNCICFACSSLSAEFLAFFQEFLEYQITLNNIIIIFKWDKAVSHERILVALFLDILQCLSLVHLAHYRIGILSRTWMFTAVGNILCRIVDKVKSFLTNGIISLSEPVDIKSTLSEFLGSYRCILCDNGSTHIIGGFVHMCNEVIAGRAEAFPAEIILNYIKPLRSVHSRFNKTLFGNISLAEKLAQLFGIVRFLRHTNSEEMAECNFSWDTIAEIIAWSVKCILAESRKYLHESLSSVNSLESHNCISEFSRSITTFQFAFEYDSCQCFIYSDCKFCFLPVLISESIILHTVAVANKTAKCSYSIMSAPSYAVCDLLAKFTITACDIRDSTYCLTKIGILFQEMLIHILLCYHAVICRIYILNIRWQRVVHSEILVDLFLGVIKHILYHYVRACFFCHSDLGCESCFYVIYPCHIASDTR